MATLQHMAVDSLPDPRTVSPHITRNCVDLLCVMLARKKEHRHRTWEALLADMRRVTRRFAVHASVPQGQATLIQSRSRSGSDTKLRSHHALHTKHSELPKHPAHADLHARGEQSQDGFDWAAAGLRPPSKKTSPGVLVVIASVVSAVLLLLAVGHHRKQAEDTRRRERAAARHRQAEALEQRVQETIARARSGSSDYKKSRAQLMALERELVGTPWAGEAENELRRLKRARDFALNREWQALRSQADRLFREGKHRESVALLSDYDGDFAKDLETSRANYSRDLTERIGTWREAEGRREAEAAALVQARLQELVEDSARDLLAGRYKDVIERIEAKDKNEDFGALSAQWTPIRNRILAVAAMDRAVLDSFGRSMGLNVMVGLKEGPQKLHIRGVRDGLVEGERRLSSGATIMKRFARVDLSDKELFGRVNDDGMDEGLIRQGLVAMNAKFYAAASRCFQKVDGPLAKALHRSAESGRTHRKDHHGDRHR